MAAKSVVRRPEKHMRLLGLPIDTLTMDEAVRFIDKRIDAVRQERARSGTSLSEQRSHVVTINPEIAWAADNEPQLRKAVTQAELVVPDGIGVVLAGRLKGNTVPERVAGYDLMQNLCRVAAEKGYSCFFLGAAPGVAEEAIAEAKQRYPGLIVLGSADGYFDAEQEEALIQHISALQPDLLFCALGPPRPAEIWINRHLPSLDVAVAMGVGGSFNVMAGRVVRAPKWVQAIGLEWLHRVIREPKRIGRLAAIPKFLWKVLTNNG